MKKIVIILSIILTAQLVNAQSENDALRYSQLYFGGTARSMSMGGAFGATGADMSTLSTNPAGIGLYNRSEISISPMLHHGKTESVYGVDFQPGDNINYVPNETSDSRFNFGLHNLGAVFTFDAGDNRSEWKKFQFGIGVNRLKNFNNQFQISGKNKNPYGTILEPYWSYATTFNANGNITGYIQPDQLANQAAFDAHLAYQADLLYDQNPDTDKYEWTYDALYGGVEQRNIVETSGALDEVYISFGTNYKDRLYLGGTIGFQNIEYQRKSAYHELDVADTIPFFNSLSQYNNLKTTGSGVNLKLGAIYRASEWIRLGLAVHTPTFFNNMNDQWNSRMHSSLTLDNSPESFRSDKALGEFDYELRTPMRLIASATILANEYGMISADYEIVDYSAANLDSNTDDFMDANDYMSENFQRQHNIRIGTEWRYNQLYIRGGYAYYGTPYNGDTDYGKTTFMTFGLGYRSNNFFIDFAYVRSEMEDTYYIYDMNYAPTSVNEYFQNRYMTTLGFTF